MIEILATIPVYKTADWIAWMFLISLCIILFLGFLNFLDVINEYNAGLLITIPIITAIIAVVLVLFDFTLEYKYDKYIARIPPETTFEEINKYEILKHYDYSDVYEVKLKEIK